MVKSVLLKEFCLCGSKVLSSQIFLEIVFRKLKERLGLFFCYAEVASEIDEILLVYHHVFIHRSESCAVFEVKSQSAEGGLYSSWDRNQID